jgi:hypothetical protein
MMEGIEVDLPVLEGVLLNEAGRLEAAFDRGPDGVVGAHGFVGRVPEAERLLRDRDAEATLEVAHGLPGGVAQVITAHRLHDPRFKG